MNMHLEAEPNPLLMGHPLLFQKQDEITETQLFSETFKHNLKVLKESQYRLGGIGLSAPQIGWGCRVFCIGIDESNRKRFPQAPDIPFQFWINPKITKASPTTSWTWEGCISVPGMRGWVERPSHIHVEGFDEFGEHRTARLDSFVARVFQHEFDHLNGFLFPMRITDMTLLVSSESLLRRDEWATDWPTPNAYATERGALSSMR